MYSSSFDRLTRLFVTARSRRTLVRALLSVLAGLLPTSTRNVAEAHNPVPDCRRIKNKQKRTACLRRAQKHNRLTHCYGRCKRNQCETCVDGHCTKLYPLCNAQACQVPECLPVLGHFRCRDGCAEIGGECCKGICYDPCPPGQSRGFGAAGDCGCRCPPGQEQCSEDSGLCIDIKSDRDNCGECGKACPFPDWEHMRCCQGTCRAVEIDRKNCGECGTTCAQEEDCLSGKCKTCADVNPAATYCGRQTNGQRICAFPPYIHCYVDCNGQPQSCAPGQYNCGAACVPTACQWDYSTNGPCS